MLAQPLTTVLACRSPDLPGLGFATEKLEGLPAVALPEGLYTCDKLARFHIVNHIT